MPVQGSPLKNAPWWFALGFCLCLFAGTVLRFSYNEVTRNATATQADAASYVRYAMNLHEHGVFSKQRGSDAPVPDSYWAPGYPAFLAATLSLADSFAWDRYRLILALQALLGIFTIYLSGLLACRFLPYAWALLPPALVALSPHLVAVGQNLLTETLFGFLLLAGVYNTSEAMFRQPVARYVLAGLCLALAWLVNPVSLFLAPGLLLVVAVYRIGSRDAGLNFPAVAVALLLPVVLVFSGWSLRNQLVVPVDQPNSADRLLTNLVIGMHSDFYPTWRASKRDPNKAADIDRREINGDYGKFVDKWMAKVAADPQGMARWYVLDKPQLLWGWNVQIGYRDIYIYPVQYTLYHVSQLAAASYNFMHWLHKPLLFCGLLGLLLALGPRSSLPPALVAMALLYVSLVYLATQSDPRYSFPLRAPLYLMATYALYRISLPLAGRHK